MTGRPAHPRRSPGGPAAEVEPAAARRQHEQDAWHSLRELVMERYDSRREVADALGISFLRVKVLRRLVAGPSTMSELAASLGTDPPHTTVLVDELERRGYVQRELHPTDRRVKVATLTAEGRKAARRADAILERPPKAVQALSDPDLGALVRITRQLLDGA